MKENFTRIGNNLKNFFVLVNYSLLGDVAIDVFFLSLIALLPLVITIIILSLPNKDLPKIFISTVTPGEVMSLALGFVTPTVYFFIKTHGNQYPLPWKRLFYLLTWGVYLCSALVSILAKRGIIPGIDMKAQEGWNFFYSLSTSVLLGALILWIYRIYHEKNSGEWTRRREQEQQNVNAAFIQRLNQQ